MLLLDSEIMVVAKVLYELMLEAVYIVLCLMPSQTNDLALMVVSVVKKLLVEAMKLCDRAQTCGTLIFFYQKLPVEPKESLDAEDDDDDNVVENAEEEMPNY